MIEFIVHDKAEFERAMEWCESKGYEWRSGSKPTEFMPDCLTKHPCEIEIDNEGEITWGDDDESIEGFDAFFAKYMVKEFDMPTFDTFDFEMDKHVATSYLTEMTDKYRIRSIQYNPEKRATTVIFADGDVIVVKRAEGQEDDIYFAVASAVAEKVYGSNSAFKRIINNKAKIIHTKPKAKIKTIGRAAIEVTTSVNDAVTGMLEKLNVRVAEIERKLK